MLDSSLLHAHSHTMTLLRALMASKVTVFVRNNCSCTTPHAGTQRRLPRGRRGFICAEVASFEVLKELGNMPAVKVPSPPARVTLYLIFAITSAASSCAPPPSWASAAHTCLHLCHTRRGGRDRHLLHVKPSSLANG